MPVTVNGEVLKIDIAFNFRVSVISNGEITTVDMGSTDGISIAIDWREIGIHDFFAQMGGHFIQRHRSGFSESTAKSDDFLKLHRSIDKQ